MYCLNFSFKLIEFPSNGARIKYIATGKIKLSLSFHVQMKTGSKIIEHLLFL